MDYDRAVERLEETRSEAGLGDDMRLDEVDERYIELTEEGPADGEVTVRMVRVWCGVFRRGSALREHAIGPDGTLLRVRSGASPA